MPEKRGLMPPRLTGVLADVLPMTHSVDCRIQVFDARGIRTVSVAGRLGHAHIPDLLTACGEVSPALQVDLSDVVSADAIAVDALSRIHEGGAQFIRVPQYIQMKFDALTPRRRE